MDWATISVWGWILVAVTVILAIALLALIILAIRYLLKRMEREDAEPPRGGAAPPAGDDVTTATGSRQVTRTPSPVPPENPHAPPSPPAGQTRPGY